MSKINRSMLDQVRFFSVTLIVLLTVTAAFAQGPATAFTFQGKLGSAGALINGAYEMQFKLFDGADPASSNQVGTTITMNNPLVQVTNGVFTVQLDFGAAALPGDERYLEIGIRSTNIQPYAVLSPRTKITSAPYAVRSRNATTADSLSTAASNSFIQNTTTQQPTSNFSISGDGVIGSNGLINHDLTVGNDLSIGNSSSITGNLTVGKDALFEGNATISGNTSLKNTTVVGDSHITHDLVVSNNAVIGNLATGTGDATVAGNATINGSLVTQKNSTVLGNETVTKDMSVGGSATIVNNASISGSTSIGGSITVSSNASIGGQLTTAGNLGIGGTAGTARLTVSGSGTLTDQGAARFDLINTSSNRVFSQYVSNNGFWQLFSGGSVRMLVDPNGNVGINTTSVPNRLQVNGTIGLNLGVGGFTALCLGAGGQIAGCSSSLRYKSNINSYNSGLGLIKRLRPVSFNWKVNNMRDIGLVAEDVAAVEPLLITHNDKGEVEGVKYDRVAVVLINAVREQQTQIEWQAQQIQKQQRMIEAQQRQNERLTSGIHRLNRAKNRRERRFE